MDKSERKKFMELIPAWFVLNRSSNITFEINDNVEIVIEIWTEYSKYRILINLEDHEIKVYKKPNDTLVYATTILLFKINKEGQLIDVSTTFDKLGLSEDGQYHSEQIEAYDEVVRLALEINKRVEWTEKFGGDD